MATYKAVLTPKDGVTGTETDISLDHVEMSFTIGEKLRQDPEQHMRAVLKDWHLSHFMDFTVEEVKPSEDVVPVNAKVDPRTCPIPGMYVVRYTKPGGRIELESCMKLFARKVEPFEGTVLQFSARPRFGTQSFRARQILSMTRVPDDAELYINHDPRKKTKPISWPYKR